jgi:hypothetical protein
MSDKPRSIVRVPLLVAVAILAAIVVAPSSNAASTKTHARTYMGTDFHSLDHVLTPQFAPFTGGGAYLVQTTNEAPQTPFMEVGVDLPNGAQVIDVTFFYRSCHAGGEIYFGSYGPGNGSSHLYFDKKNLPASTDCTAATPTVFQSTGPLTTTKPGTLRYVLGASPGSASASYQTHPDWILLGAKIRYSCAC